MAQARRSDTERDMSLVDFSGGLNLSVAPGGMSPNESALLENLVPSGKCLETRPGLSLWQTLGGVADTLHPSGDGFYFTRGQNLYRLAAPGANTQTPYDGTSLGQLSGNKTPSFVDWGDGSGVPDVVIASGGRLQVCRGATPTTLEWISGAPNAHLAVARDGRLWCATNLSDRVTISGIGDYANWQLETVEEDTHTDADAQWVDVGYKENGEILAMQRIGRDLLIFKDNAKCYRIVGTFPDFYIYGVPGTTKPAHRQAVRTVGNDVVLLDECGGLRAVTPSAGYGDVALSQNVAPQVQSAINGSSSSGARVWVVEEFSQLWVRPSDDPTLWVRARDGAWSTWVFGGTMAGNTVAPATVTAVCERRGDVFVAIKWTSGGATHGAICRVSSSSGTDMGTPIVSRWKGPSVRGRMMTVRRLSCVLSTAGEPAGRLGISGGFDNRANSTTSDLVTSPRRVFPVDVPLARYDVPRNTEQRREYVLNAMAPYHEFSPMLETTGGVVRLESVQIRVQEAW